MADPKQVRLAALFLTTALAGFLPAAGWSQTSLPSSAPPQANRSEPPKLLTIYSALSLVDATHPSVTAKRQEVLSAQSTRSAAWQQMLPTLSANRSRGETDQDKSLTTATIKQPLFAGGRISGGIDKADAQIQESESLLTIARRDLMNRTATVYIEVIKSRAKLTVAENVS